MNARSLICTGILMGYNAVLRRFHRQLHSQGTQTDGAATREIGSQTEQGLPPGIFIKQEPPESLNFKPGSFIMPADNKVAARKRDSELMPPPAPVNVRPSPVAQQPLLGKRILRMREQEKQYKTEAKGVVPIRFFAEPLVYPRFKEYSRSVSVLFPLIIRLQRHVLPQYLKSKGPLDKPHVFEEDSVELLSLDQLQAKAIPLMALHSFLEGSDQSRAPIRMAFWNNSQFKIVEEMLINLQKWSELHPPRVTEIQREVLFMREQNRNGVNLSNRVDLLKATLNQILPAAGFTYKIICKGGKIEYTLKKVEGDNPIVLPVVYEGERQVLYPELCNMVPMLACPILTTPKKYSQRFQCELYDNTVNWYLEFLMLYQNYIHCMYTQKSQTTWAQLEMLFQFVAHEFFVVKKMLQKQSKPQWKTFALLAHCFLVDYELIKDCFSKNMRDILIKKVNAQGQLLDVFDKCIIPHSLLTQGFLFISRMPEDAQLHFSPYVFRTNFEREAIFEKSAKNSRHFWIKSIANPYKKQVPEEEEGSLEEEGQKRQRIQ